MTISEKMKRLLELRRKYDGYKLCGWPIEQTERLEITSWNDGYQAGYYKEMFGPPDDIGTTSILKGEYVYPFPPVTGTFEEVIDKLLEKAEYRDKCIKQHEPIAKRAEQDRSIIRRKRASKQE